MQCSPKASFSATASFAVSMANLSIMGSGSF
jgi:hypothetical protein